MTMMNESIAVACGWRAKASTFECLCLPAGLGIEALECEISYNPVDQAID